MASALVFLITALITLQQVCGSTRTSAGIRYKTYHVFFKPLSWSQAYMSCRRLNMFLATFHNEEEYSRLRATLVNPSTLVANQSLAKQRLWLGGGEDSSWDFIWLDSGKPVEYDAHWGPRQPDHIGHCLAVSGTTQFRLANWPCENVSYYICHSFRTSTTRPPSY